MTDKWDRVCCLCAARGRKVNLETGHVCASCLQRIDDDLKAIVELASFASIEPISGTGQGRSVPGSRPPIAVEGIDPELTVVRPDPADPTYEPTVLELMESWTRMIRDERNMSRLGPWTLERLKYAREGTVGELASQPSATETRATLTVCVTFLRGQVSWIADTPDFPIDVMAGEVRACRRALSRWDPTRESDGTMVKCPTVHDDGSECGYRLRYSDPDEVVTCRRCGSTRDAMTLVAVALADGEAAIWVDPEAAARESGVSQVTLKKWARRGLLHVSHGMYDLRAIRRTMQSQKEHGHLALLRRVT